MKQKGGEAAKRFAQHIKFVNDSYNRDIKNVVFWVDNCSFQNKCWYLYTALCDAVNNNKNPVQQTLTFILELA